MELDFLLAEVANSLRRIDSEDTSLRFNQRTGATYHPGLPSMNERDVTKSLARLLSSTEQQSLFQKNVLSEYPYPNIKRAKCDLVIPFEHSRQDKVHFEWAIEVKAPVLIGDNGKNNDYNVQKMLSPYLKDRSLVHDIDRLLSDPFADRLAVIGYMFSYSDKSCDLALQRHPNELSRIDSIREVVWRNDPTNGTLSALDLIIAADRLLQYEGVVSDLKIVEFNDLWAHPCGGEGYVFGWELIQRSR